MPVRNFAFPAAAVLGVLVACRDAMGPRAVHRVNLFLAANTDRGTSGQVAGATVDGGFGVAVGSDELIITRARIVLREIDFERERLRARFPHGPSGVRRPIMPGEA